MLFSFKIYFNYLLSNLLSKTCDPNELKSYDSFVNFLVTTIKEHRIWFHTLNHDLLIEKLLLENPLLTNEVYDGFSEKDSKFYATNHNTRVDKVLVPVFNFSNRLDKQIYFLKLHGSLNFKKLTLENQSILIKEPPSGTFPYYVKDNNEFKNVYDQPHPECLSGTTEKIKVYHNSFYQTIINQYESNLKESNIWLIIGYGFLDAGINKIMQLATNQSKKVYIVNPRIKDLNVNFLEPASVISLAQNFKDTNFETILN